MTHPILTSRGFQEDLADLAKQLKQFIESGVTGLSSNPASIKRRRLKSEKQFQYFAKTYFPHYISQHDSVLHTYLYERLPKMVCNDAGGTKLAVAAPRGEAKSTLVTQLFTLWCAVMGHRHYCVIIMDAQHQSSAMLEAIKAELSSNPRLLLDYPDVCGQGGVWKSGVAVTKGGIKIQAFGSGRRMRGLRHGALRPDLVICDDLENDENVQSRSQRAKLENWLRNAVLKLGPADDSMDVLVVGTVLHHDSLLSHLLNNPLWESARFQAIIRWPDEMPLWDQWQECLINQGEKEADLFFQKNKKRMQAGAQLSWPQVRTLETLMKIRARDGMAAFDAELQNRPLSKSATFGQITFWVQNSQDWFTFGAVDPSLGKSGSRGDPSAILVGGFDRVTGVLNVLEADIRVRLPDRIIGDVMAYQEQYECRLWVVETIQFQEFFKDELVRRSARLGVPIPAKGVKPLRDKSLRISSLQPHIANGLIRFHQSQGTLLEQLRQWGEGGHDDGPDALEMLWRAANDGMGGVGDFQAVGRPRVGYEDVSMGGYQDEGFGSVGCGLAWEGY